MAQQDQIRSSGDLQRRLFQNSALIFICRIVSLTFSLVSVPFVIRTLGFQGYGTWEALMAVSIITTIPQSVIGGTLLWKMSSAFGVGDVNEIIRLARLGVAVTIGLSAIVLPTVWMLRSSLVHLLNISGRFQYAAKWILPCIVLLMLLGGINESLGSVIRGCQSTGLSTVIQTIASILNSSCVIGALLLGSGLWSLLIGFAIGFALTSIGFYAAASRICPGITLKPVRLRTSDLRSVAKYVSCLFLGTVSASLRTETDKIILASLASPTWAGYYGLAARLAGLVMEASNFFYVPTIAAVGAMYARNDWPGIRALYAKLMIAVPFAAGAVVVVVAGLPQHIMVLWIGRYVPEVYTILSVLLCGYASAVILTGPGTCVCKAIGRIEIETAYLAVSLLLNLGLTIVLVASIGPFGTVIATAVSWTVGAVIFTFLFHKRIDVGARHTLRAARCFIVFPVVIFVARVLPLLRAPHGGRTAMLIEFPAAGLLVVALFVGSMVLIGAIPKRAGFAALTACGREAGRCKRKVTLALQLRKRESGVISG
jgi:O-antigen/teichoic acid export membrane protein